MPNDLSIGEFLGPAASPITAGTPTVAPAKFAPAAARASPDATASAAGTEASLPSASPNPTLELNAALGIVVIEFRSSTGAVVSTIPTQQQLEAYQHWQQSGVGQPPNIGESATSASTGSAQAPSQPRSTSGGHGSAVALGVGD